MKIPSKEIEIALNRLTLI
ncbi:hypothetical protein CO165_00340 [Candidatus Roizmanbacteria bacterium CG_4_9_14_3_um_filter_33_18]|uniref:Uncharacterized protein n=2 Tax=Candidatus Roizmaniibacteriota TaxID=1752723 RepID=A0A2M7XZB0_9BACT|nr:MAG: hypothetical protein COW97_02115 [Candidatus Roizmanbacteria bacterium CG22_combo_CG10-13_8_21_14_all_34_12]PJA56054.1 MAG: hypothetical protein CO165_00340 [Candidatus Roizmanbacteria bacterium CG_4_9_14_3_um_filter_33_18]